MNFALCMRHLIREKGTIMPDKETPLTKTEEWVAEYKPDNLDKLKLCLQLGDLDTEHYWGYLPTGSSLEDAYSDQDEPFVGVFKKEMNGYKWATERTPYPSEDELVSVVTKLEVTGDDLKKDKWTLLAEEYIRNKNV